MSKLGRTMRMLVDSLWAGKVPQFNYYYSVSFPFGQIQCRALVDWALARVINHALPQQPHTAASISISNYPYISARRFYICMYNRRVWIALCNVLFLITPLAPLRGLWSLGVPSCSVLIHCGNTLELVFECCIPQINTLIT